MNKEIENLFYAWIDEVQASGLTRFEEFTFNLSDQEAALLESTIKLAFYTGVNKAFQLKAK